MQGNQDTFYLTLPSNGYDTIYRDNTPGRFKAKLLKTISLPGREWEVALSRITFPSNVNYEKLSEMDFMCGLVLDMKDMEDKSDFPITNKEYFLSGSVMKYEYTKGMTTPRNVVDFWNRMLGLLNYHLHSRIVNGMKNYITQDKDFQTKRPRWPVFHWQDAGGDYRLFIDNSGIDASYRSGIENQFYIHLDIAKAFKLVIPKNGSAKAGDKGYQLSSLVSAEHFRDPVSTTVEFQGVHRFWTIIDTKEVGFKPEGVASNSLFLRLQASVNWYIYGLGYTYHSPMYQKRPLYMYKDLVQTQIMGRSETDLLSEVEYDGSAQGDILKNSYEPQNLQFIPVRKNVFDTIEIGISEADGTQTEFVGNSHQSTVVTLCFRKRLL